MIIQALDGLCQHCARRKANRARRLCAPCYRDDAIRGLYKPYQRISVGLHAYSGDVPPLSDAPTDARPGTVEKVRVMEARALAGQHVHHPKDAR